MNSSTLCCTTSERLSSMTRGLVTMYTTMKLTGNNIILHAT